MLELSCSSGESLAALFALEPEAWLRRVPGRETFAWPGEARWIVKRFVGGEPRDFWYERLRGGSRSSARREAENLLRLTADGFAVPRALAWFDEAAARRHPRLAGSQGRSALVMEYVPHAETLRGRFAVSSAAEARAWLDRLVAYVTRLHAAGWYHRDLYLQHFVLRERAGSAAAELVLLDVGRARREVQPRARWFVKDLAALQHSAPAVVSRADRLRFLRAWLRGMGEDAGELRSWAAAVVAKAQRIAAHEPRLVDRTVPLQAERPPA
ncbi:MAG: hypothetical protein JRG82_18920 [Deltaproteobacteria bacterium]|nr:hypothetical protein [Deltaproteobacteria bacterium]